MLKFIYFKIFIKKVPKFFLCQNDGNKWKNPQKNFHKPKFNRSWEKGVFNNCQEKIAYFAVQLMTQKIDKTFPKTIFL